MFSHRKDNETSDQYDYKSVLYKGIAGNEYVYKKQIRQYLNYIVAIIKIKW